MTSRTQPPPTRRRRTAPPRRTIATAPSRSVPAGSRRPIHPSRPPVRRRRPNSGRRAVAVLLGMVLLFVVVIGRMAQLQLLDGQKYAAFGASQRIRPVELAAERGAIFDRDGADLALSVPQQTVWADPRLVSDPQREADALAPVLGMDRNEVLRALTTPDRAFVYLARQVDDATAQKVKDLDLDGIELLTESKRFNPSGELARSVLGSVNIDNLGRAGLEQKYDGDLTGTPGEL